MSVAAEIPRELRIGLNQASEESEDIGGIVSGTIIYSV
jgi:hypothetical protein